MGVAHEAGDTRRVAHRAPRLVGQVHAYQDVAGDADATDDLLLRVLDLRDLFHGDLDLEDEVLHVQALDAVLQVGLHTVLVARVGVDDEPVARLGAQVLLELLDRVQVVEDVAVLVDAGLVVSLCRLLVLHLDVRGVLRLCVRLDLVDGSLRRVELGLGAFGDGLGGIDVLRLVQRLLGHERTCFLLTTRTCN